MSGKTLDISQVDSIVQSVISKFVGRASFGRQKYGTDLDRTDLGTADWIQHAQEELMDGILYLEKLRQQMGLPLQPQQSQIIAVAYVAPVAAVQPVTPLSTPRPKIE